MAGYGGSNRFEQELYQTIAQGQAAMAKAEEDKQRMPLPDDERLKAQRKSLLRRRRQQLGRSRTILTQEPGSTLG